MGQGIWLQVIQEVLELFADHVNLFFLEVIVKGQGNGSLGAGLGDGKVPGAITAAVRYKRL